MIEMSLVRILGLVFAAGMFMFCWLARKGRRLSRGQMLLMLLLSVNIGIISISPSSIDAISRLLGFAPFPGHRLLMLATVSILFILFITFKLFVSIGDERNEIHNIVETVFSSGMHDFFMIPKYEVPDVLVVIPAYNEAENLKKLIPLIQREFLGLTVRPLIVSDGSKDETVTVSRELGALVLEKNINRGGGAALKSGYFMANLLGVRYIVTMDADGQHRPEDIPTLLEPLINNKTDIVAGSRTIGTEQKNVLIRKIGIRFFSVLTSTLLGKRITDPSNGFRAFSAYIIKRLNLREQQFHTSELIIEAVSKGYRFMEVPVHIMPRFSGESKKPKSLKYGFFFLRTILRTYLRS
jgi:GT2 family glycosyltransferase